MSKIILFEDFKNKKSNDIPSSKLTKKDLMECQQDLLYDDDTENLSELLKETLKEM